MKLLGITQGGSLRVFWQIARRMGVEQNSALYVSNSRTYARARSEIAELDAVPTLKEWEIVAEARTATPDMARLQSLQQEIDQPLWHAALADRRVFFGTLCKSRQDYRPRYSEDEILAIIDVASRRIEDFLDRERPDAALAFGTSTFADYLFEVLCRRRGIPYGQLKATKIRNNVGLLDSGIQVPQVLARAYAGMQEIPSDLRAEAHSYLHEVRQRGVKYEGAILFSRERMFAKLRKAPRQLLGACIADMARARDVTQRNDPHIPPSLPTAWYAQVVHPLRTYRLAHRLPLLGPESLAQESSFAFYPMHFEPEVSLQIFGRPFQNQIEVVRTLALSLPVGMKLLVKEHPRSLGFRKESYYRKLLDIPNVRLVDPFIPTIDIVQRARLVCVVSGSVGLEAAIAGKPVLVLGSTHYTLLPETMVQQAGDLNALPAKIRALVEGYVSDEAALERYLAALLSISVPANLYTKLLSKADRYVDPADQSAVEDDYARLARLVQERLPEMRSV